MANIHKGCYVFVFLQINFCHVFKISAFDKYVGFEI